MSHDVAWEYEAYEVDASRLRQLDALLEIRARRFARATRIPVDDMGEGVRRNLVLCSRRADRVDEITSIEVRRVLLAGTRICREPVLLEPPVLRPRKVRVRPTVCAPFARRE